ncbi:DivIVA domain-containing protein [Leucobacter sp. OH2974_COT-288]|uniref:DivIVA domain-containing protein n=1 Tax=Canibacter oris TaxID=1365628 RepID=UPI000F5E538A|nr:DivIVA domain-containing protein [Canibacter oris]RRD36054.1 DivIVA domain-containing protein [Leucobacter sp. OH2974_COT-288]
MPLTPEQVKNKTFTTTKFRDGYDPDEVDDFLDEVVADFEAYEAANAELQEKVAALTAKLENAPEGETVAQETAQPAAEAADSSAAYVSPDAQKSSAMLQLALELHDKHVREGETKREQLITEGENEAKRLVTEAETERTNVLNTLGAERVKLEEKIKDLRDFEKEYRDTLTSYIQAQLRNLDNDNEPAGGPALG